MNNIKSVIDTTLKRLYESLINKYTSTLAIEVPKKVLDERNEYIYRIRKMTNLSLNEIGKIFNISRERVSQIIKQKTKMKVHEDIE